MKYQLIGKKAAWEGKTLWEIVGNLKNFGVGRLVKKWDYSKYPEPSYFRIVKVQPVPPPKSEFEDRRVMVVVDEIFRGVKQPLNTFHSKTELAKFQLIPKSEEAKIIKETEEFAKTVKIRDLPKYQYCPFLYKILWEKENMEKTKTYKSMPNIDAVINEKSYLKVKLSEEKTFPRTTSDLNKLDVPVEDLIREIVKLKKILIAHSIKSES